MPIDPKLWDRLPKPLQDGILALDWVKVDALLDTYESLARQVAALKQEYENVLRLHHEEEARDRSTLAKEKAEFIAWHGQERDRITTEAKVLEGKQALLESRLRDTQELERLAAETHQLQQVVERDRLLLQAERGHVVQLQLQTEQRGRELDELATHVEGRRNEQQVLAASLQGRQDELTQQASSLTQQERSAKALIAQGTEAQKAIEQYLELKLTVEKARQQMEADQKVVAARTIELNAKEQDLTHIRQALTQQKQRLDDEQARLDSKLREVEHKALVAGMSRGKASGA